MTRGKVPISLAILFAITLIAAACGSDSDEASVEGESVSAEESDGGADEGDGDQSDEAEAEGEADADDAASGADEDEDGSGNETLGINEDNILIGPSGFTIDLNECPSDWSDTAGVTDTEIRLGSSFPLSGPLAAFGNITVGQRVWYDHINETEGGVDGKDVIIIVKDDAYEPARSVTNVEEMLQNENVFSIVSSGGTPHTLANYDRLNEECVPMLQVPTGHPAWGDPNFHPWTVSSFLAYNTEARLWGQHLIEELEAGTFGDAETVTVAALVMNNDFGLAYRDGLQEFAETEPRIEIVDAQLHDPAAPNVVNEMTTLAGTDADVVVAMTTAVYCTQAFEEVAQAAWDPKLKLFSNTCAGIESFFEPAGDAGVGWRHTSHSIDLSDAALQDLPLVQEYRAILEAEDLDPGISQYGNGFFYAQLHTETLQQAALLPGGVTRTNAMIAARSMDFQNGMNIEGIRSVTDGVNDAYPTEAAVIKQYELEAGATVGSHAIVTEVVSVEGMSGLCHYVNNVCINE